MQTASSRSRMAGVAIILVMCLTSIGSYQKLRDLERSDSALYAYGGALIEQGGRLYRDLWDHKPPGVYAVNALAFRLAGGVSWGAAVAADTGATLLSVAACAMIVRRTTRSVGAAIAAAVAAAFYLNLAALHEGGGMAEIYMTALLAWAGWAFMTSRTRRAKEAAGSGQRGALLAVSGGLAGLAILCKPTAMTTVAACLAVLMIEGLQRRRRNDLGRQLFVYLAGLGAPLVVAGVVFWRQESLGEFVDASLLYNLSYVGHGAGLSKLWTLHLRHNVFLLAGLVIVVGAVVVRMAEKIRAGALSSLAGPGHQRGQQLDLSGRRAPRTCVQGYALSPLMGPQQLGPEIMGHGPVPLTATPTAATTQDSRSGPLPAAAGEADNNGRDNDGLPGTGGWRVFLPIWLVFEWVGIYAGNFDNGQYLLGCVIPLSCLVGIGAAHLVQRMRSAGEWRVRGVAAGCVVLAAVLAWLPVRDQWRETVRIARGEVSDLAIDQVRLGERISRDSQPNDRIWVWGYAPQVYLAAQRWPATRFVFDGAFLNSGRVMRGEFREMLRELAQNKPAYVVDAATTGWFAVWLERPMPKDMPEQANAYRAELAELQAWVRTHYVEVDKYGELIVYRRRGAMTEDGVWGMGSGVWGSGHSKDRRGEGEKRSQGATAGDGYRRRVPATGTMRDRAEGAATVRPQFRCCLPGERSGCAGGGRRGRIWCMRSAGSRRGRP